MITLAIDASTYTGDVAVLDGDHVLAEQSVRMKGPEHEALMPAVAACLQHAGMRVADVSRIVCGAGPGSFTSLRIAASIAKGIALGAKCPLYAVPSMALIVGGAQRAPGRYLVAVDALRGELYIALFDLGGHGSIAEVATTRIIDAASLPSVVAEYGVPVVSPTLMPDATQALPRARVVGRLQALMESTGPVDLERWEPAYGRLAEAQVKWEAVHGRALATG